MIYLEKTPVIAKKNALSDKNKQRLYPVVLDLFSKKDFHQVNIREIYKLSGLSPSTIYRYFTSKEDLLFTILDEKIIEIRELIKDHIRGLDSTKEIFRKVFWVTLDYYDNNPGVAITAFITVPMRAWMREDTYTTPEILDILNIILEHGRKNGEIDPSITPQMARDLYYMFSHRQIYVWYYHQMKWKLVDTIPRFFDQFWKIMSPKNR